MGAALSSKGGGASVSHYRNSPASGVNSFLLVLLIAMLALTSSSVVSDAQDLEPRAYALTPVGLNFLIGGYAYSEGTVGTDPSVPLTDTEVKLNSAVVAYVRTLDLWGRSGKFDIILPYSWADGSAKLAGEGRARKVSGFNDPRLRFSMLLYGAPALSLEAFRTIPPTSSLERAWRSLLHSGSTTQISCSTSAPTAGRSSQNWEFPKLGDL